MARTTRADIESIIEIDTGIITSDAAMDAFILPANELVTEMCVTNGPSTAYTSTRLELIERYLAAHFYTNRDPRISFEGAGGVTATYQNRVDLGFDTSHYGQMAMRLDTNGQLAKLNRDSKEGGKKRVGVTWLGTAYNNIDPDAEI